MRFEWDPAKDRANRVKHGLSFRDASTLLSGETDCLEVYDGAHSQDEDRFMAMGPIRVGVIVVVYTVRSEDVIRIVSARHASGKECELYEARRRNDHR